MLKNEALAPRGSIRLSRRLPGVQAWGTLLTLLVALVALAVRLLFSPRVPVLIAGDTAQYYEPAAALLSGQGFPLPLLRQPLYSLFLAALGAAFGTELETVVAVQHVLGVATALMAYWLGRLVYGRPVGLLAGLLVAVSGGQLLYEHYIMSEGLFTVLITAASLLWVIGLRGTGNRPALLASGLMFGACALTRSYAVAILPLAVGLAFTAHLRGWRALKRAGLLVALGMAVVLAPWTARNYVVHGMLAPSGGAGQHLVSKLRRAPDLSFESEQAVDQDEDESLLEARELIQDLADAAAARGRPAGSQAKTLAYLMETYGLSEAQADDLMRAVAIDAIRAKPEVYAELVVEDSWENLVGENERLQSHWKLRDRVRGPEGGPLRRVWRPTTEWQEREQQTARRLMGIYQSAWLGSAQGLALLLGIVAAAIWPGARQGLFLAAMVLLAHVVTGLAVPGSARFHHPTDPLAQVVSVGGIWLLGSWVIARVRRGAVLERATRPRDLAAT